MHVTKLVIVIDGMYLSKLHKTNAPFTSVTDKISLARLCNGMSEVSVEEFKKLAKRHGGVVTPVTLNMEEGKPLTVISIG